jgi:predicted MPP superfamily phosphohydrolase
VRIVRAVAAAGGALAAYSFYEPFRFRIKQLDVPLRPGAPSLSILHVSDLHMKNDDRRLQAFLRDLPKNLPSRPDLLVATGDMIEENAGIGPLIASLRDVQPRLGAFYVLGSHDYYQSEKRQYSKYFTGRGERVKAPPADTASLEKNLARIGWVGLTNRTEELDTDLGRIRVTGVDDPYLRRHRTDHISRERDEVLALGLMHAPDVVSEWALNGFDVIFAGHTHGGQVRLPGVGAVVTNCSLPSDLAGGLSKIGETYLHVSPGLGNGKFTPIRFNCRPEVTLLRLR